MYCQCGCGGTTTIAPNDSKAKGWIKGQPIHFIQYHHHRLRKSAVLAANTNVLCACGCGELTNVSRKTQPTKGHVKGQPYAFRRGHHLLNGVAQKTERYEIDPDTGCWNWLLYCVAKGYGVDPLSGSNGKKQQAHRAMYIRHKGPIPEGYTLDHLCNNTSCVNPDHLEPVTASENSKRKNGTSTYCPSLSFLVISARNAFRKLCRSR